MTFSSHSVGPVITMLKHGPVTPPEISDAQGITRDTARQLCASLHQEGHIYIATWKRYGSWFVPAYIFGRGVDAPKQKPKRIRKPKTPQFDPFFDICR